MKLEFSMVFYRYSNTNFSVNLKPLKILKTIYLIRHGETEYNRLKIVQGSGIDAELNPIGKAQADAFFEHYKDVTFDKVYTSDLIRTKQSVEKFIKLGLPTEHHEGLNEISWGNREGRKISAEDDQYYQDMLKAWAEGNIKYAIDSGESPYDVQTRQKPVLKLILSRKEEKRILICMHGRAMRIFLALMLHYPLKNMDVFEHSNLCLYKITYTGESFRIDLHNNTEHLKNIELEKISI